MAQEILRKQTDPTNKLTHINLQGLVLYQSISRMCCYISIMRCAVGVTIGNGWIDLIIQTASIPESVHTYLHMLCICMYEYNYIMLYDHFRYAYVHGLIPIEAKLV